MRLLRHAESIVPMWEFQSVPSGRGAASRWSGPGRSKGRDGRNTPCPSVLMSSGRLFLDRVGRHHYPSPLRRQAQNNLLARSNTSIYHQMVPSVLTGCLSRGGHPTLCENAQGNARMLADFSGHIRPTDVLTRQGEPSSPACPATALIMR